MDNRSMVQRGFVLSDMTDHEFAAYIRSRNATHMQYLIGTVWSNKDETVAVVVYDNTTCTRSIWIK